MPSVKIAAIGCAIPGNFAEVFQLESKASLLDFDIILFQPALGELGWWNDYYQGKPSLPESRSARLQEAINHWKKQLAEAYRAGKLVIVLLSRLHEVYIDTGRREYSGTGRNRATTRIVDSRSNYDLLPVELPILPAEGEQMKLTGKSELLADYWRQFGEASRYNVLLEKDIGEPLVVTRSGGKTAGAVIKDTASGGAIVLLPFIDLDDEAFSEEYTPEKPTDDKGSLAASEEREGQPAEPEELEDEDEDEDDEDTIEEGTMVWTAAGLAFGGRFRDALVRLAELLSSGSETTPEPEWATDAAYVLPRERELRAELLGLEQEVEELLKHQVELNNRIEKESGLRRLLFEKGPPLEHAIRDALELMGFHASPFKEGESEFDVVFESAEGRFIGEAEGKDHKAVGIDKLRQLEMNILEDFARDDVDVMAKGVLFGNGHRLAPLAERGECFTPKVLTAAARGGTALVRCVDLFKVAQYLSGHEDDTFARDCRVTILNSAGAVVQFPDVPASEQAPDAQSTA